MTKKDYKKWCKEKGYGENTMSFLEALEEIEGRNHGYNSAWGGAYIWKNCNRGSVADIAVDHDVFFEEFWKEGKY